MRDVDSGHEADLGALQQYEILWILPRQRSLSGRPAGFAVEIDEFLGPGDRDHRGERTVWVRGPVVGAGLHYGEIITVAVPHDQPRARRTGGAVLPPVVPDAFAWPDSQPLDAEPPPLRG
jgi:hypothetical protein